MDSFRYRLAVMTGQSTRTYQRSSMMFRKAISYCSIQNSELLNHFLFSLNQTEYVTQVQRTILLVIDAMRTDFIQNANNASMKHTNKQLDKRKACLFNIQVESPTVTMPRIKAMTTGTVPNFIDVMLNLGSSELKADSLVHQMHDKGGRIVFCGDNTWVKMFPEMFHRKLENEDSLFVNDFYEASTGDALQLFYCLFH